MNNTVELEPLHDERKMDKTQCTPCKTEDEETEAHNYCTECEKYFCGRCLKFHKKFSICQSSNVLDRSEIHKWGQKQGPAEMRHKCEKHPNKDIEMFCKAHDIVCCHVCVALEHRSCNDIAYIPSVAKNLQATDLKIIVDSSKTIIKEARAKKTNEEHQKTILDESKVKYQASIYQVKQKYASILDSLEEKTTQEMSQLYNKQSEAIQKAMCDLNQVTDTMEDVCKTMTTEMDECRKFIQFKESGRKISEAKRILQSTNRDRPTYKFTTDEKIDHFLQAMSNLEMNPEKHLSGLDCLGISSPVLAGRLSKEVKYDAPLCIEPIQIKNNLNTCLSSTLSGASCRVVVKTHQNMVYERQIVQEEVDDKYVYKHVLMSICASIILTDKKYCGVSEQLLFKGQSISKLKSEDETLLSINNVTENDVVMLFSNRTLIFWPIESNGRIFFECFEEYSGIRCEDLAKTMTFQHDCFAAEHHDGILYITSRDGCLYMYDLGQTLIKKVETDQTGNRCFVKPMFVTKSHDKTKLHVTDWFIGLITLDMSGQVLATFSHPKLVGACGITTEIEGYLLVGGYHSKNVLQMNITGDQIIQVIIDSLSTPPFRLSYLSTLSCLLVSDAGQYYKDIKAFKIKKKNEKT